MQLNDFVNYHVDTISPDDSLQRAAEKMRDIDVGSLPVCDGSRLIGMLTDRDITIRATAQGDDPMVTKVREVMSPDVIACRESASVEEAAQLMREQQVRRLFVLNDEDQLVGVVSLGDLATATGDQQLVGATLERISDSAEFQREQDADPELTQESAASLAGDGLAFETRVSGLFDDSEQAKEAVEDLKDAGFADELIAVAINDAAAQDAFFADIRVHTASAEELPSLPELDDGQVLVMVDAAERAALALEIIHRNHGVTGGVRMPAQ